IPAEPLTLNGSGVANTGALRNLTGNNTWAGSVTLQTDSSVGVDSGRLSMTGAVGDGGSAFGLIKIGPATLEYAGSAANTYGGTTQVNEGTLVLNKGATAIAGGLTVGDAQAGAASASWLQSNQVADASAVTVNSDGSADLNFKTEAIGALSVSGVLVSAGTLAPPGNNTQPGGSLAD